MNKKITMASIAEACGTSIGTVDRALHNRGEINSETKKRILDTARQLGYKSNTFAGALSRRRTIRLAIISCENHRDFFSNVSKGIKAAENELEQYGVKIDILCSENLTVSEQMKLLSEIDISCYDGFAINPSGSEINKWINNCYSSNIPVITFNNDAPESNRLFYIGNDAQSAGSLAGEIVGKMLRGNGIAATLNSSLTAITYDDRSNGFIQTITSDYPGISVIKNQCYYNDESSAYHSVIKLLNENPELSALYATRYTGTVGAIRALKFLNRKDIILIGHDIGKETVDALECNWCSAVLFQNPFKQGYYAASLLAKHILESWLPEKKKMLIPTQVFFKNNYIENQDPILK